MSRAEPSYLVTEKVTDIHIQRRFIVECNQHGVLDETVTYAAAIACRREHWFTRHAPTAEEPDRG